MSTIAPTITIERLLAVPDGEPERVFERGDIKADYRTLVKRFHPDHCDDQRAADAVELIGRLYKRAMEKDAAGIWERPGVRVIRGTDGKNREIRFRSRRSFELGEILVGNSVVAYLIDVAHRDLHESGLAAMKSFTFADKAMRNSLSHALPSIVSSFESQATSTSPGYFVTIIRKTADQLLLSDVIEHFKGEIDVKHAAWMLSALHNLACWLAWSKISHQALSPEHLYISPQHHTVSILGGWWYTKNFGDKLTALPGRTALHAPSEVLRAKLADPRTDLTLVRRLGREMLGDIPGSRSSAPENILRWLHGATAGDARADYRTWSEVRDRTLGPRKFTALNLTADDLYPATA